MHKKPSASQAPPVVMTIAGSDSGGGAGIQADLKTFTALGVFGTSAITCLTAQNPAGVRGIQAAPPRMVALQMETVASYFRLAAAKTGMLYSAAIIEAVARSLRKLRIPWIVVDPVMIATSGARLLRRNAEQALRERLLPLARVITPNVPEAEVLLGRRIDDAAEAEAAAGQLARRFRTACVLKGGHLAGSIVTDLLYAGGHLYRFRAARLKGATHGTGCMFSAALCALLARGKALPEAVRGAQSYVHSVLENSQAFETARGR